MAAFTRIEHLYGNEVSPPSTTDTGDPKETKSLNRREFLTYAWGAAFALVGAQSTLAGFLFLQPRFRTGEFGGTFVLGSAAVLPAINAAPQPLAEGKFWLVNTANGPKALYMVCTHLGCLYKWEAEQNRFRCPCHGSQFDREGNLLKGPATRPIDQFEVQLKVGNEVVTKTEMGEDGLMPPMVVDAQVQVVVDTGNKMRMT